MTKETYDKFTHPEMYVPKHAPKWYSIYRVLGPTGPEEKFYVYGRKAAEEAILGCWDWSIETLKGEPVR